jgi:hypothetical protein
VKLTFEQGSFTRVAVGLITLTVLLISATINPADRKQLIFWAMLCTLLTWQQYTLYQIKKREDQIHDKQG